MKLIFLLVGAALGFAGGIWVGVHNPDLASSLDKKREEWYLKGKMEATAAIKDKLDQALSQQRPAAGPTPGASFAGGSSVLGGGGNTAGGANATDALRQLRDEQQQQLQSMQSQLNGMGKK